MGTFVTGNTALPPLKVDAFPPQGLSTELDASDINNLWSAAGDLRTHVQGWVNVKSYGAKGDGSTDDTSAIQSAIDALLAASGGELLFPPGYYKVTSTLNVGLPEWDSYGFILSRAAAADDTLFSAHVQAANVTANIGKPAISLRFAEGAFLVASWSPGAVSPVISYNLRGGISSGTKTGSIINAAIIGTGSFSGGKYVEPGSTQSTNNLIGIYAAAGAKVIQRPWFSSMQHGLVTANAYWTQINDTFFEYGAGDAVNVAQGNAMSIHNTVANYAGRGIVFDGAASDVVGIHTEQVAEDLTIFASDACTFGPGYFEDVSATDGTGKYAVRLGYVNNGVKVLSSTFIGLRVGSTRPNKKAFRFWDVATATFIGCRNYSHGMDADTVSYGIWIGGDFSTFSSGGTWDNWLKLAQDGGLHVHEGQPGLGWYDSTDTEKWRLYKLLLPGPRPARDAGLGQHRARAGSRAQADDASRRPLLRHELRHRPAALPERGNDQRGAVAHQGRDRVGVPKDERVSSCTADVDLQPRPRSRSSHLDHHRHRDRAVHARRSRHEAHRRPAHGHLTPWPSPLAQLVAPQPVATWRSNILAAMQGLGIVLPGGTAGGGVQSGHRLDLAHRDAGGRVPEDRRQDRHRRRARRRRLPVQPRRRHDLQRQRHHPGGATYVLSTTGVTVTFARARRRRHLLRGRRHLHLRAQHAAPRRHQLAVGRRLPDARGDRGGGARGLLDARSRRSRPRLSAGLAEPDVDGPRGGAAGRVARPARPERYGLTSNAATATQGLATLTAAAAAGPYTIAPARCGSRTPPGTASRT
jgi:hypothetical protein